MKRAVAVAATLLLAAVVTGTLYETLQRRSDRKRLPRIGRAVDIINCAGVGSPVVVFDSGAGSPGYAWSNIQRQVAEFTQACWYDRAGEGWSEPGPFPRTSATIASDLHELLHAARVPPPYVLVGHSFGGLNVRAYAGRYADDVAGMVLIESAHEDEPTRAPAAFVGPKPPRFLWRPMDWLFRGAARVGITRLTARRVMLPDAVSQRTPEQILDALRSQPSFIATTYGVGLVAPDSYEQARAAGGIGDRPLIVLTRGQPFGHDPDPDVDRALSEWFDVWVHELQANLAKLSTNGRQVIVPGSGHGIPEEAPGAVVAAVREVVTAAGRQGLQPPGPATRSNPPVP